MEEPEASPVVCDAGPLIHLDELGCLDLLSDFSGVYVPEAVWTEVKAHRPSALRRRRVKLVRWNPVAEASPALADLAAAFVLDPGEFEALRTMHEYPGAILLTDDAAARLVAEQLGYDVHGTIGVIVRAIRRRQRSKRQVLNILRSIPRRSRLFIRAELLASVIEEVEQSQ